MASAVQLPVEAAPVKRCRPGIAWGESEMDEDETGDWVAFAGYERQRSAADQLVDTLARLRAVIALALDIVPESAVTLDAHDVLTLRQRLSTARLLADGAFSGGPAHG